MGSRIRIFAPATVANIGPGFDVLGLALQSIGDDIDMQLSSTSGIKIKMIGCEDLPTDPTKNVAGVALQAMLDQLDATQGFDMTIHKNVLPGSGLGSSASSSAGAVFAANELLNSPFTKTELIQFAMAGEASIAGKPHADNVAPSLLGGVTLVRSYTPLDVVNIGYPEDLLVTVVHPQIEVKTSDSKKILRKEIPLELAVAQWGNVAGLVSGFASSNFELIGRSLQDLIVEPTRAILIPGFNELKASAILNGGLGCSISGSGPSVFALSNSEEIAQRIGEGFKTILNRLEIENHIHISTVNANGAIIIK